MGSGASLPTDNAHHKQEVKDRIVQPSVPSPRATNESTKANDTTKSEVPLKKIDILYKLGDELGSGAFSVVKRGIQLKTGREYAVKIISKKDMTPDDFASLMLEIELLDLIDHPRVIKLIETIDEGNEFYIVTELVEGGELFDRIVAKSHYTEKEARDLIRILLDAIDHIHTVGIVHRDLKPENILLTSAHDDFNIKICDFGFAKRVTDLHDEEVPCGTPGYVAPEILKCVKYGAEVDVWSLGVICYIILAGYPPFYDEDQKKLFKKIISGRYYFHEEYWSHISEDAKDLIRKMLCVDQKQRWTAKQLLQHKWVVAGDEFLSCNDLSKAIPALKQYQLKKKLRKAVIAVTAFKRMNKLMEFRSAVHDLKTDIHDDTEDHSAKLPPSLSTKMILVEHGMNDSHLNEVKTKNPAILEEDEEQQ